MAQRKTPKKSAKRERKVPAWKPESVKKLQAMVKGKKVIGIIDISGLPSPQLQEIKKKLRGTADIQIFRNMIIERAFKGAELEPLLGYIKGPSAIVVSNESPFKLFSTVKKSRSKAAAKPGSIATKDIIVPAGETDLPAGPALAELKTAKIDVRLDKGKIVIARDSLVAKQGEILTPQIAGAIAKLGIKPVEIGMHISAVYEDKMVYPAGVLDIDEEKFLADLIEAVRSAVNLAVNASYPAKDSISLIIMRAHRGALAVANKANILTSETVGGVLLKGNAQANTLKEMLGKKGYT